jgi:hypothetical protein
MSEAVRLCGRRNTYNARMAPDRPRPRALVVEDEAPIRELLRLHLDLGGFVLDEAGDGRRGLDLARATPFDLIPGWYQGRATHIHVEATVNGRSVKVSQIAFPEAINNTVHTSGIYASRGTNPMSNQSDGIFADSLASELVTPVGSVAGGYTASFQLGIAV